MTQLERRLGQSPESVTRELTDLLGPGASPVAPGALHVCSCCEVDGALCAIRIGPGAPGSELDAFMLRAARAEVDAIVTTGSILRHEPKLVHTLGEGALGRALVHHRERVLGKQSPPLTVVLSASGELPDEHPLWHDWTHKIVWTEPGQVERVRRSLPASVEVVQAQPGGPGGLLRWLRARGARRVSLEAGPSAVKPFYAAGQVSTLWCARLLGQGAVDAAHRGAPWPFDAAQLNAWREADSGVRDEASGRWRFERCRPR